MRCAIFLAVFSLLGFVSTPSHAWGDLAHHIICEIAFQELEAPARDKVKKLMRKDSEYRLFAKACAWPDHPRIRRTEHYVNLERNDKQIGSKPCPVASKCVISAILSDMRELAYAGDEEDQLRLLKSLSHWVGDEHQPLHVSFADDSGGNKIDVDSPCNSNHGRSCG